MLEKKIEDDLKEALKSKESVKVSTLRMLKAAVQNKAIERRGEDLKDSDIVEVLKKQVKQHKESIEAFLKGDRKDLVEKEKQELNILAFYMPPELSSDEILKVVLKAVKETDAQGKKDIGKVMKVVMLELKGKADGASVNKIVIEVLIKQEGDSNNGPAEKG